MWLLSQAFLPVAVVRFKTGPSWKKPQRTALSMRGTDVSYAADKANDVIAG